MSDQTKPTVISELRTTAQLMTLEPGVFCVFHQGPVSVDANGLPGVRISQAPMGAGNVQISTFRDDGWIGGADSAALIRVDPGRPGQVLVTIYQAHDGTEAPRLQVVRLAGAPQAAEPAPPASETRQVAPPPGGAPGATPGASSGDRASAALPGGAPRGTGSASTRPPPPADRAEVAVHINRMGDVLALLGDWAGERGSRRWIEGFAVSPRTNGLGPADIEYQGVLGRDWLSPWSEGGQYCGSRGMALPLLGLRVRLRGAAAEQFDILLEATFVNGTSVGPVTSGEACETPDLAALEAFKLTLAPRNAGRQPAEQPAARQPATRPRAGKRPAAVEQQEVEQPKADQPAARQASRRKQPEPAPEPAPAAKRARQPAVPAEPAPAPAARRGGAREPTRGGPRRR